MSDSYKAWSEVPAAPLRQRRVDLEGKISFKFEGFQGFLIEMSANLSSGGMFIRTTTPQPPGSTFDFELLLTDEYKLIHGRAEVVWVRESDEGFDRPSGMGVRFVELGGDSRKLIDRIVAERLRQEAELLASSDLEDEPAADDWGAGAPRSAPVELASPGAEAGEPDGQIWDLGTLPLAVPTLDPEPGLPRGGYEPGDEGDPLLAIPPPSELDPWPDLGAIAPALAEEPAASDERIEAAEPDLEPPIPSQAQPPESAATGEQSRLRGPSPYSRSYLGPGSRSAERRRRPWLALAIALVALIAVAAAIFLFTPDSPLARWLGGDEEGTVVADRGADGSSPEALEAGQPRAERLDEGEPSAGAPADVAPDAERPLEAEGSAGAEGVVDTVDAESTAAVLPPEADGEDEAPVGVAAGEPGGTVQPAGPLPGATRVLNVTWEERSPGVVVTVYLDGSIEEWEYSRSRLAQPLRELVQIRGIQQAFARTAIPAGVPAEAPLLEGIRTGFHPEAQGGQLHVVLDLAPGAIVERSEVVGSEIRLYLSRDEG